MIVSNWTHLLDTFLMQILISWKLNLYLSLYVRAFVGALLKDGLQSTAKDKEKRLLFDVSQKGHLTTKMDWLHFCQEERKVTFVMSGDKRVGYQMPRHPWTNASVLQMYGSLLSWGHVALFSLCVWLNYWPGRRHTLAADPSAEMGKWKTDMKRWAQSPFGPRGPIVLFIEGDRNGT